MIFSGFARSRVKFLFASLNLWARVCSQTLWLTYWFTQQIARAIFPGLSADAAGYGVRLLSVAVPIFGRRCLSDSSTNSSLARADLIC